MLDPWYVTGFCDGEAAFTYSRAGRSFALYFSIKQREDNQQIIEEIRQFFHNVGDIYRNKEALPTAKSGLTQPASYFRVNRADELSVVTEHFDKYPLQSKKKYQAYQIWREMVMHKLEHFRRSDYDKLKALAERLSSLNMQSRSFKVHRK